MLRSTFAAPSSRRSGRPRGIGAAMAKRSRHSVKRVVPALVAACVAGLVLVPSALAAFGPAVFGPARGFAAGSRPVSVAVGDLNGDAKPDLAVANRTSNDVSVLAGTGSGSFG